MLPIIYTYFIKTNLASFKDLNTWFVNNPSQIFGLKPKKIEIGEVAELTILDINNKRVYEESEILSKSKNSPYIGMEFYGFPICTILKDKIVWRDINEK